MKKEISSMLLGIYNLILAAGAIYNGGKMVLGLWWSGGEFPPEWLSRVPFRSWFWPGVIAIVVYGVGNIICAIYSFSKYKIKHIPSLIMGIFFLVSLLASIFILGDGYLPTFQFIILAIIQIILSLIVNIEVRLNDRKV